MKKKAFKTPRTVQTEQQLCDMPRDNIDIGNGWWMLIQQSPNSFDVVITAQRKGEMPTQQVKIPRRVFTKMVDWFNTCSKSLVTR